MNYLILIIYINLQSVSISILMACKMLSLKTKSSILWTCSKITLISLIRWISLMRILYVRQKYSLNCYIRLQLEISTFYLPIIDRHLWAKLVYHNKDTSIRWSFTMIAYSDVSFLYYLSSDDWSSTICSNASRTCGTVIPTTTWILLPLFTNPCAICWCVKYSVSATLFSS